eukprot:4684738-Amphidinium_carterae.1
MLDVWCVGLDAESFTRPEVKLELKATIGFGVWVMGMSDMNGLKLLIGIAVTWIWRCYVDWVAGDRISQWSTST